MSGIAWYATRTDAAQPAASASRSASTGVTPTEPSTTPPTQAPTPVSSPAAKVSVKPAPSRTPSATASASPRPRPAFRFPVPVSAGNARQIITVDAHGSYATVVAWQLRAGGWHQVVATTAARVGTNGVVPAATRTQGTGTTPGGTFTLTEAFGIDANPGTKMPYHHVISDDWWVEDNNSAYYNQMRRASQGGFDTSLPPSDTNSSEHLINYSTQYRYVVVIDFNRWPAVRYRGAGIFLHVNGPGSTAGCVSVPLATMISIIDWLDPAQHPRIAIA